MTNENMLIGDADGNIAWTIIGRVPRRAGYDGRLPVGWGYGDRRWDGYLSPDEIPVVSSKPGGLPAEIRAKDGALWSGNNRALDGPAYALLGDSGYDDGARGGQIRDGLLAIVKSGKKATPADLLAIGDVIEPDVVLPGCIPEPREDRRVNEPLVDPAAVDLLGAQAPRGERQHDSPNHRHGATREVDHYTFLLKAVWEKP